MRTHIFNIFLAAVALSVSLCAFATTPDYKDSSLPAEQRARDLIAQMTIEEKIDMLSGYNDFFIHPVERLGIEPFRMADGPLGIASWGLFGRGVAFPSALSLASSWDRNLARQTGKAYADEWRSRGIHLMLAPGVNIYRNSRGARNFEYFGEDPYLTGEMAGAFVDAVQQGGVLPVVKHFVGNDQEFDRYSVSTEVDIRTLREIYALPFEKLIRDHGMQAIMSGYNLVNGVHCSESQLLDSLLHDVWKFDGMHMSDWGATESTLGSLAHGVDMEMGSNQFLTRKELLPLLEQGVISDSIINLKVERMLTPLFRMGFFDRPQLVDSLPVYDPARFEAALEVARNGIVLLANRNNLLPIESPYPVIAVVGPTASPAFITDRFFSNDGIVYGGGGSSKVNPWHVVTDLDGIRAAFPDARVLYAEGVSPKFKRRAFAQSKFTDLDGNRGLTARYYPTETATEPIATKTEQHINNQWGAKPGGVDGLTDSYRIEWLGTIEAERTDTLIFFADAQGAVRVWLGDSLAIDGSDSQSFFFGEATLAVGKGDTVAVRVEYTNQLSTPAEIRAGYAYRSDVDFSEAERIARMADVVVCCVGMDGSIELEGRDRPFELPYGQDELVERMLAIRPESTVVVVHGGGAVDMSRWADRTPAIIHALYAGQEGGTALGEILAGAVNPSAKLTFSIERNAADSPSAGFYDETRREKKIYYGEGVFTGYRGYDKSGIAPLFPFGHGLSYTQFSYSDLTLRADNADATSPSVVAEFTVTNTGSRPGTEIAELYVSAPDAPVARPEKELKGFERIALAPGESRRVAIPLGSEAFRYYDAERGDWHVAPGTYIVRVGSSSASLPLSAPLPLK